MRFNSILVVCVGNICRSPTAERLLMQALPHKTISSAGISAMVGQHADGSPLPLVLSLGVENGPDGKKTFIATLRPDQARKMDMVLAFPTQNTPSRRGEEKLKFA
jgi:protein-tyrosine-phosphatase